DDNSSAPSVTKEATATGRRRITATTLPFGPCGEGFGLGGRRHQFAKESDQESGWIGAALHRHDELFDVLLEDRVAGQSAQPQLLARLQLEWPESRLVGADRDVLQSEAMTLRPQGPDHQQRFRGLRQRAVAILPFLADVLDVALAFDRRESPV